MLRAKSNRRDFMRMVAGLSAGVALSACAPATAPSTTSNAGEATPAAAGTALIFSMWGDLFSVENMQKVLDSYEASNAGVTIEIEHYAFGDYNQKIPLELAAGSGPDVI